MYDAQIINLDTGSCLIMTPERAPAKAEKENNNILLQACLERRHTFTPMVYYVYGITGTDPLAAKINLASYFRSNMKQEYYKICEFARARMSLEVVRYNSLLFYGTQNKEA